MTFHATERDVQTMIRASVEIIAERYGVTPGQAYQLIKGRQNPEIAELALQLIEECGKLLERTKGKRK